MVGGPPWLQVPRSVDYEFPPALMSLLAGLPPIKSEESRQGHCVTVSPFLKEHFYRMEVAAIGVSCMELYVKVWNKDWVYTGYEVLTLVYLAARSGI